ncbi:hypothetical protein LZ575_14530 [Antarcticibacterium sp. 1MA-6-2]|uniref:hypothetical protein n=1 Tax=Antarcticibacterium sp. 1MA-6-2 TaxID=2908210 RepID=UPI001F2CEB76|nr:hypothetical protein [Antarcticibacterium sp. 1MA-6-2]UJH90122.1 hypothetical protein LZ575_14530 [Antarcticibacterium sp. 1MA-6-2]
MDRFILNAGKVLARWRSQINYFLEEKVQGSKTNLILFLLSFFIVFILSFSLIFRIGSLADNYLIFLALLIITVLVLVWVAIFYESNKYLETNRHNFQVIPLKKFQVKFELLDLDHESQQQFVRLMKGLRVRNKINFTMGNKSGESANHRILFVLFDELIVGGIQDLTGERKHSFFTLLMDSFLMNSEPLKENTLKTSFSAWKNDQEKINSRNQRKFIKKVLGIE